MLGKFWGGGTIENWWSPGPDCRMDGWTILTWTAWAAGLRTQQHGVARCHGTWHMKSVGHAICFESPPYLFQRLTVHFRRDCCFWIHEYHQQTTSSVPKPVAISFLPQKVCLNFLSFSDPQSFHTTDCFFVTILLQDIQFPSTVTMWSRNFSPSLWYRWRNVKADDMRWFLCSSINILGTQRAQTLW